MYTEGFVNTGISSVKHNLDVNLLAIYQIRVPNRNEVMEYLNANDIFPGVHIKIIPNILFKYQKVLVLMPIN